MHPFLGSKLTMIALASITIWMIIFAVQTGLRRHNSDAALAGMETRIDDAQRENGRLAQELTRMQQPAWLALLARQQLNYQVPGETVVFVYKSEKPGTVIQPQQSGSAEKSRWLQWLDWLRGK
jgi:cell division protein FtsB